MKMRESASPRSFRAKCFQGTRKRVRAASSHRRPSYRPLLTSPRSQSPNSRRGGPLRVGRRAGSGCGRPGGVAAHPGGGTGAHLSGASAIAPCKALARRGRWALGGVGGVSTGGERRSRVAPLSQVSDHSRGGGVMATALPTCEALGSRGTGVTTVCGRTQEGTGVEPAPRPGREGAGGALRRQHQIGRWLGRARGAGKAKPKP